MKDLKWKLPAGVLLYIILANFIIRYAGYVDRLNYMNPITGLLDIGWALLRLPGILLLWILLPGLIYYNLRQGVAWFMFYPEYGLQEYGYGVYDAIGIHLDLDPILTFLIVTFVSHFLLGLLIQKYFERKRVQVH